MLNRILIVGLIVGLQACKKQEQVPENLLNEDQMTHIFLNNYILEAKLSNNTPRIPRDSATMVFEIVEDEMLDSMNINEDTYNTSLQWYYQRPDLLDKIYERVIDSLNLMEQRVAKPEDAERKKKSKNE